MDLQEFKRMNNIVVHSATNGWRALIYKVFEELSDENNEVDLTNSLTSGYRLKNILSIQRSCSEIVSIEFQCCVILKMNILLLLTKIMK